MQMGERPALQQSQENDRLQPLGSNSLTFATKSALFGPAALCERRQLSGANRPSRRYLGQVSLVIWASPCGRL